jgi:ADP-ribosylation factor-like protein 13B
VSNVQDVEATPTFGFNVVHTSSAAIGCQTAGRRCSLQLFDLGGGKNIRRVWRSYLSEVHGVVYVVDAADAGRMAECRVTLQDVVAHPSIPGKPVLVLANKQDLPDAAKPAAVAQGLGLAELLRTAFHICGCTAKPAPGQAAADPRIREGIGWLLQAVQQDFEALDARVQKDTALAREEEARRKQEREQRALQAREERARLAAEQQQQQQQAEEKHRQEQELLPVNVQQQQSPLADQPPVGNAVCQHGGDAVLTRQQPNEAPSAQIHAPTSTQQHVIDIVSVTSGDLTDCGALSPQSAAHQAPDSPPLPAGLPGVLPQLPPPTVLGIGALASESGRPASSHSSRPASRQRVAGSTSTPSIAASTAVNNPMLASRGSNRVAPVVS